MEIKKKSAGPVDQSKHKETEAEFLDRINPQLDVITQMQTGAQEVDDAKGAAILRHLDTENLVFAIKRNYHPEIEAPWSRLPSILRRWLLSGRRSPWACFEVEEGGPRTPAAVGPEGWDPSPFADSFGAL